MVTIVIIVILICLVIVYHYLFSIYEVEIKVNPNKIYIGENSRVNISVIPINVFSKKLFLRKAHADFEIILGENLADVILIDKENGKMILQVKEKPGKVVVRVKCEYALLPSEIEINIFQKFVVNNK